MDSLQQWSEFALAQIHNDLIANNPESRHLPWDTQNWIAIAAQWVQEKGWTWWETPQAPYNVGNVTKDGVAAGFEEYPTLEAGVMGYVYTLTKTFRPSNNSLVYQNVLDAFQTGGVSEVLKALSESPYCAPPYPLQALQDIADTITQKYLPQDVGDVQAEWEHAKEQVAALAEQLRVWEEKEKELALEAAKLKERFVVVTEGTPYNTLWNIAADPSVYHDGRQWVQLLSLNPGLRPTELQVGQKIRVQ